MRLSELTRSCLKHLQEYPLDTLGEKHEKTTWHYYLTVHSMNLPDADEELTPVTYGINVEFLHINDLYILLPVPIANHDNITVNQCILSEDKLNVTLFLTDRTYYSEDDDPNRYMAVCKKIPDCKGYICCIYHSTYLRQMR